MASEEGDNVEVIEEIVEGEGDDEIIEEIIETYLLLCGVTRLDT
jgi:hypothetical protein